MHAAAALGSAAPPSRWCWRRLTRAAGLGHGTAAHAAEVCSVEALSALREGMLSRSPQLVETCARTLTILLKRAPGMEPGFLAESIPQLLALLEGRGAVVDAAAFLVERCCGDPAMRVRVDERGGVAQLGAILAQRPPEPTCSARRPQPAATGAPPAHPHRKA